MIGAWRELAQQLILETQAKLMKTRGEPLKSDSGNVIS
jgi:hypothetical protein